MNGRLKLIEEQLLGIDSAAFQNLCDAYLNLREKGGLTSINRTGSQLGKQKTVKGTPDTFFRLADGRLIYVEYTTTTKRLVNKTKTDIDKCLDPAIMGVPANQIHKIIICFNSRISVDEETEITQHAVSKKIQIELIGLDWLALEIYSKYLILAKDILGIPLDTGQLLPLQSFVNEYTNKAGKLSTPLDNIFLHRKTELTDIENILTANDLLIISGSAGVGKTKIALEALNNFLSANKDYSAFAVSNKDQDISEDLKIQLQQEHNYILMVDDANRQLINFKQILGIFKEKRKGNIKLLITVRDYALNDIKNESSDFGYKEISLGKFTDEEITQLISSDSFEIKNHTYQKRIVELADGNARLAIMAARLAKQEQIDFLLGENERIFELYDYYFKTFIKDINTLGNDVLTKTLGIISFFFTIDRSNKAFLENILNVFEIDYYKFNEAIKELEKKELVEVQFNYVRVSEQVMATYFFYKVFIKDELLSFKTLLFTFFSDWQKRFSDTIIPSNNSFGYNSVFNKINGAVVDYLNSVYDNEEKVLEFFSLFWVYKREETLSYFYQKTQKLPEPESPIYDTKYETNDFAWKNDRTLIFLAKFFNHNTESYIPALELAFEHCRKSPESLPNLIKIIKDQLLFDEEDSRNHFQRQVLFFNLIIEKFKSNEPHYVQTFFALCGTFLLHHFHITKGGRKNSITYYDYPLPFYGVTKRFRESIWTTLLESYDTYPKEVFLIIKNFNPSYKRAIPEVLNFDLSFLLPFIENKLDPTSFEHAYFIHDFVLWLNREDLQDRSYQNLISIFSNKEYEYFKKLEWDYSGAKRELEIENHSEFEKLKEQEIRSFFIFQNENDFMVLHSVVSLAVSIDAKEVWGIGSSIDIVIQENFIKNEALGFKYLQSMLRDYPAKIGIFWRTIKTIVQKDSQWALKLWDLIYEWEHNYKIDFQLVFFDYLPVAFCDLSYKKRLIETINSIDKDCWLQFESFEKFIPIKLNGNENLIEEILSIVCQKIESENLKINLSSHFFEKYSAMLSDNFDLLAKAYIQQEKKVSDHFDYSHNGLKTLLQMNPNFLLEYIRVFYAERENFFGGNTRNQFPFVWDLPDYQKLVEDSANLMIENSFYFGISEHSLIIFFHSLNSNQKTKAKQFLLDYISQYFSDSNKMNAVFDVLRHSMKEFEEDAILHYLQFNTDIENFKNISWTQSGGVYDGGDIIGEIRAKDWQKILSIVEKSQKQMDIIPIKAYIKKQIESELKRGEAERKEKFINPNGIWG